jgi:hypothetical protein
MDDRDETETTQEEPTLRQRLHAATGDRDAEARALADRADDVELEDAERAVRDAHGDSGAGRTMAEQRHPDEALAEPSDAREVHEEGSSH